MGGTTRSIRVRGRSLNAARPSPRFNRGSSVPRPVTGEHCHAVAGGIVKATMCDCDHFEEPLPAVFCPCDLDTYRRRQRDGQSSEGDEDADCSLDQRLSAEPLLRRLRIAKLLPPLFAVGPGLSLRGHFFGVMADSDRRQLRKQVRPVEPRAHVCLGARILGTVPMGSRLHDPHPRRLDLNRRDGRWEGKRSGTAPLPIRFPGAFLGRSDLNVLT